MPATYDDITRVRRAGFSPEVAEQGRVFELAYAIAVQLIDLRECRGLTRAELADRCGVDEVDIGRLEQGGALPTVGTLHRLAAALDADMRLVPRST